jgi:hypothetical protein
VSRAPKLDRWFSRMSRRDRYGYWRSFRLKRAIVSRAPKLDRWFSRMSSRIRYGYWRSYGLKRAIVSRAPKLDRWFSRMSSRIRYGYRDHAPQLFGLILCSLVAGVLLIWASLDQDSEPGGNVLVPAPRPPPQPAQGGPLVHTNLVGGYAFTYPRTWTVVELGAETDLASPDGETVLSFGSGETLQLGDGGGEHPGDQDLLRSLGSIAEPTVLGTAWQQVAGHRSLLVSGTADDLVGRSIRFLVIAIPGERPTYAISIVVPAHSAPNRMLPRLERIVASFDILDDGASTDEIALFKV